MSSINLFTDLFEEEKREEEVQKILPVPLWKKIARIVIVFFLLTGGMWYYIGWYMTKQAYLTEQSNRGINTSDYESKRNYFDGEPEEFHSYKDFDAQGDHP